MLARGVDAKMSWVDGIEMSKFIPNYFCNQVSDDITINFGKVGWT